MKTILTVALMTIATIIMAQNSKRIDFGRKIVGKGVFFDIIASVNQPSMGMQSVTYRFGNTSNKTVWLDWYTTLTLSSGRTKTTKHSYKFGPGETKDMGWGGEGDIVDVKRDGGTVSNVRIESTNVKTDDDERKEQSALERSREQKALTAEQQQEQQRQAAQQRQNLYQQQQAENQRRQDEATRQQQESALRQQVAQERYNQQMAEIEQKRIQQERESKASDQAMTSAYDQAINSGRKTSGAILEGALAAAQQTSDTQLSGAYMGGGLLFAGLAALGEKKEARLEKERAEAQKRREEEYKQRKIDEAIREEDERIERSHREMTGQRWRFMDTTHIGYSSRIVANPKLYKKVYIYFIHLPESNNYDSFNAYYSSVQEINLYSDNTWPFLKDKSDKYAELIKQKDQSNHRLFVYSFFLDKSRAIAHQQSILSEMKLRKINSIPSGINLLKMEVTASKKDFWKD